MKNKHIWLFYISFLGIHFSNQAQGENKIISNDTIIIKSDSLNKKTYKLRFGFDPIKTVLSQTDNNYNGIEIVGDLSLFENLFLAIELGTEDKTKQSEKINFTTTGSYIKLGADYNMYKNWKGMNNQIYIGFRFSKSLHKQRVNSFYLRNSDFLWGNELITSGTGIGLRENLNASWIEFITGIKVQVLKNIYMGFSVRFNRLLSDKKPLNFDNLYIPGFNKKTDENIFGAGFNYTISYSIPIKFNKSK